MTEREEKLKPCPNCGGKGGAFVEISDRSCCGLAEGQCGERGCIGPDVFPIEDWSLCAECLGTGVFKPEEKLEPCPNCGVPIHWVVADWDKSPTEDKLKARIAELEEALRGMIAHSCVADTPAEDKFPEDHEAERKARAALRKSET